MKININNVVHRTDDQPERPILGTPLSLTVTMGRWAREAQVSDTEMKTIMVDFTVDVNIRQLSRDQLGDLARDVVNAVVDDTRWKEEFVIYVREVGHFRVDFFPRLIAEGSEEYATWNWGNKWSRIGSMGPTYFTSYERVPLAVDQRFNPECYTLDELAGALRCAVGLHTSYLHGKLRGHMDWSQLDALHAKLLESMPRLAKTNELPAAAAFHPKSEWQADVAKGDTQLGYEQWLRHRISTAEEIA